MLKKLYSAIRNRADLIIYLVFGALTTAVNYLVYFPLYNYFRVDGTVSNCIAWAASVVFAFLTNKPFVFKSHDWKAKTVSAEFCRFISARLISGAGETLLIFITVTIMGINGNVVKIAVSVLVVVFNYFASKMVVFKK